MYQGFVSPPIFSHKNAKEYFDAFYRLMLRGTDDDMKMIASELSRSARALVRLSREQRERDSQPDPDWLYKQEKAETGSYAFHTLLLMGSRKLCRHIVSSSPITAILIFDEMTALKRSIEALGPFAVNISTEAIANKDSPLYHEGSGYYEGLMGYWQPFSQAVYGDSSIVRGLGQHNRSPLDVSHLPRREWDADQFKAYCNAVLLTWSDFLNSGNADGHSTTLSRAIGDIAAATNSLYKVDGLESGYDEREFQILRVAIDFFKEAIDLIAKADHTPRISRHKPKPRKFNQHRDVYDWIAEALFEVIFSTSKVTKPIDLAWWAQHNSTWGELFYGDSKPWNTVRRKLRRLLYNEASEFARSANFKNARILGYCLHVMGPALHPKDSIARYYYPLHKAILSIAKEHFLTVHRDHPQVAEACLMGNLTLDLEGKRLVKTYVSILGKDGAKEYLELDDAH